MHDGLTLVNSEAPPPHTGAKLPIFCVTFANGALLTRADSPKYNISFLGVEKLHPFDSQKYGNVLHLLRTKNPFIGVDPPPLTEADELMDPGEPICDLVTLRAGVMDLTPLQLLQRIHTEEYVRSLQSSVAVARVVESAGVVSRTRLMPAVPPIALMPPCLVQKKLVSLGVSDGSNHPQVHPMRLMASGTVNAALEALRTGWVPRPWNGLLADPHRR